MSVYSVSQYVKLQILYIDVSLKNRIYFFHHGHGQICANVSIANGHPALLNITVYQARTINGTKLVNSNYN